jgi:hypothetical protein
VRQLCRVRGTVSPPKKTEGEKMETKSMSGSAWRGFTRHAAHHKDPPLAACDLARGAAGIGDGADSE